jgi:hypothetical protein
MGSWGFESFDNDESFDWFWMNVRNGDGYDAIMDALKMASEGSCLSVGMCETIIAAAELVASAQDDLNHCLPEEVSEWLAKGIFKPDRALVLEAIYSLDQVLLDDMRVSEIAHPLAFESLSDKAEWFAAKTELRARLKENLSSLQ